MLEINSVSRVFDDGTIAVKDVSLSVAKGEFCVLLGPSGAGKSTLMNMINGVLLPTSGSVTIGDTPLTEKNRSQLQQRVGMIHQQLHLIPRLAVLHNILAGVLPRSRFWQSMFKSFPREDQLRACQLMHEVGLEEKQLYRRASDLSGGQQQRVAIARAFMSRPEIVLADEPVASLDPGMSRNVLNTLKTAAQHQQTTVICTLHQVEYALEFADRIVALRKGEVFFDGHPSEMDHRTQAELYAMSLEEEARLAAEVEQEAKAA